MPSAIPDHHRSQLAGLLGIAGATMVDASDGPTVHAVRHNGADWTAEYRGSLEGEPIWWLTGAAHPDGILLDKYGIVAAVTKHAAVIPTAECPTCGAPADETSTRIPEHRPGSPCTVDYRAV